MKVHLCIPPHKLTKMCFFMQLGIMKHRVWKSVFLPHFQKWQNYTHFNCNFYKNSKKQFCVCRNFLSFCPENLPYFHVTPKKYYVLWKMAFSRIIGKHRGSNRFCPEGKFFFWDALKFALRRPVSFY